MLRRPKRCRMFTTVELFVVVALGLSPLTHAGARGSDDSPKQRLVTARTHFQHGRYDEALEVLDALETENDAVTIDGIDPAVLACARCENHLAMGGREEAEILINEAIQRQENSALLHALAAKLHFERGRWTDADAAVTTALHLEPNQLLARLIQAHLWVEQGELELADTGYRWFVRYYNREPPKDPESLVLIGQGAAQYARWHSVSQIFDFCVNTICQDACLLDKDYWQAHHLAGQLLLEKYNRAQGIPELKTALAINPQAAEIHELLAQSAVREYDWDDAEKEAMRAIEIAPHSPSALRTLAQARLYVRDTTAAETLLREALDVNSHDQETLALLGALRLLQDGWPDLLRLTLLVSQLDQIQALVATAKQPAEIDKPGIADPADGLKAILAHPTRFEKIVIDVATTNPKPGYFLATLAEEVDRFRQHAIAEPILKQAIALMPQLSKPKTALGQLYMQTGRMKEAKALLDESFKVDPYHVRVSNMRKVLKVLDDYSTVTTEHFVIRADAKLDKLLARYMADYLEEVYPELTTLFGFEPESRTQIEIYNNAKGLSGHQWFSARMVGLPWVQTIGASTGSIIARTSPSGLDHPLNWARVLNHEFVHILTLQQTHFNIPHWYTEALAVRSEGYPRPVAWNTLLLTRVPQGELKNLDNLSMGFIRAGTQENWNFAYCQSVLYAEYMVERFGEPSLAKLLDAYRRNRTTDLAIPEVFGVTKVDFEQGYREHLDKLVESLKQTESEPEVKPSQIEQVYERNQSDPKAAADYARLLVIREPNKARSIAKKVLQQDPTQPVAAFVVATLLVRDDTLDEAAKVLEPALNNEHPNQPLLELFLHVRLKQNRPDEALSLCQIGREHFPDNSDWWKGTAAAAKLTGDNTRRREALVNLANLDADDPAPCKALAEMALAENHFGESLKYAKRMLQIDVLDADVHRLLGESLRGLGQYPRAIAEFETALELKPKDSNLQKSLVETILLSGRQDDAQTLTDQIFKQQLDHEAEKTLSKKRK